MAPWGGSKARSNSRPVPKPWLVAKSKGVGKTAGPLRMTTRCSMTLASSVTRIEWVDLDPALCFKALVSSSLSTKANGTASSGTRSALVSGSGAGKIH